jgi:Ca2+-binding RTX toxin-like protein
MASNQPNPPSRPTDDSGQNDSDNSHDRPSPHPRGHWRETHGNAPGEEKRLTHDYGLAQAPAAQRILDDAILPDAVSNDPSIGAYWHLTGANVIPAWSDYRGAGVVVGLIDDGVEYTHPDLAANYGADLDYDARDGDFDAFPSEPTDKHGTAVAGVAGAALNNGIGGAGAAPEATLAGYRIGFGTNGDEAQLLDAYNRLGSLDIANNSWSYDGYLGDNFWSSTFAPIAAALHDAIDNGRDGLGTVVAFAAGNGRASGQDVNYHNFQNDRSVIAVAATTSSGDIASFSTPGAALLVAAPGQSIPTTDRVGSPGYSAGDYTTLNGTSFSSPLIGGVAALLLDANPGLGWRDVQEILASTAVQTGGPASWSFNGATNWNGGKMHVSHDFGFGLTDATAAVRLAESWRSVSTSANEAAVSNEIIPNAAMSDVGNLSSALTLPDGIRIDHVEIDVVLKHANIGQLQLILASPGGVQSLLFHNPSTTQDDIAFTFSTTRDWGELSGGAWTLTVMDTQAGAAGTFVGWAIRAYGDPAGDDTYVYTNEFAALAASDPSRSLLSDAGGMDTLNAAAATADAVVDLRPGHASSIAGQTVTIDANTIIENADTGDGDDALIGNDANNSLRGWRGNDSLDGGLGADSMAGGPGDDVYTVDDAGDAIVESAGAGVDSVLSSIAYILPAVLENLTLTGTAAIDGSGNDLDNVLLGNGAANHLTGGLGNDALDGGGGADTLDGGPGADVYTVDDAGDFVIETAGGGTDAVRSSVNYTLSAFLENLTLLGTAAIDGSGNDLDNVIVGNGAPNHLNGGLGNDALDGGGGADTLAGGLGDDAYAIDDSGDILIEFAGEGTDTATSAASFVLSDNVENLTLTGTAASDGTGNDLANRLLGNDQPNRLYGLGGGDYLDGGAGDDVLDGGAGDDQLIGGFGNDAYVVDSTGDSIVENASAGTDTVQTSLSAYTLPANLENLSFIGAGNFSGVGNAAANALQGGAGDDSLDGGAGADILGGGGGGDTYFIDSAGDAASENPDAGVDTVRTTLAAYTLAINFEILVYAGAGNFVGVGNDASNQITGGKGADNLNGAGGADTMAGGLGNDAYTVDDAGDVVVENPGEGTDAVNSSATYTLSENVENLALVGAAAIDGTGNALNNALTGNAAANRLYGLAGNDTLNGGGGADTMAGGAGNDAYTVDDAGDIAVENPGEGTDAVNSAIAYALGDNLENLVLTGAATIDGTGNALNNALTGNAANNRLYGLDGADSLNGGAGADTMTGGLGNDAYTVDNAGDVVVENPNEGTDRVNSTIAYTLGDNLENLTIAGAAAIDGTGNALNNALTGNAAANQLYGLDGNDSLNGGAGIDTMAGGLGNDIYTVDDPGDAVTENPGEGADQVNSSVAYALSANVENLTLTGSAAIGGTGNALNNVLTGNAAANPLYGMDGDDSLNGGAGADTMAGGPGNDTYTVDNAGDAVVENPGEGADQVNSSVAYALSANVENLTLTGSAAIGGTGNALNNVLTGNAAANPLYGMDGDDTLNGGAGADTMAGGLGNDIYTVDNAGDAVTENPGEGLDTVTSSVSYTLSANVENLALAGTAAIAGTGNALANAMTGNGGNNILDGGPGADSLNGGGGNDTYIVDDPGDSVSEAAGAGTDLVRTALATYTLPDNVENLSYTGTGNFGGTGNGLANSLTGGAGADILDGGAGNDSLTGGLGDDTYAVDSAGDKISDTGGIDTVLTTLSSYTLPSAIENLSFIGSGNFTGVGNSLANNLTGGAGADSLTGGAGNDIFVFHAGETAGDAILDFVGNGPSAGDSLQFAGFDAGASLVQVGNTDFWSVSYNGGALVETIQIKGVTSLVANDYAFV